MSQSKADNSLNSTSNNTSIETQVPVLSELAPAIGYNLSLKEHSRVSLVSKNFNTIFKPGFNVVKALTYVVEGNPGLLKDLINKDPSILFKKHAKIQAPRGQRYYNVSPFLLMTFLCDKHMKMDVMSLDKVVEALKNNTELREQYKNQYAEIDCGGADIIKLDRNPIDILYKEGFEAVIQFKKTYDLYDNTQKEITHTLLENPDGIICYQNENNKKQLFYVNQNNQSIQSVEDCIIPEDSKLALAQFKDSFDTMEINSSRRSSEEEHRLIAKALKITLMRKGILYEANGIFYRDNRTPFNLINKYRKCFRLYEGLDDASPEDGWDKARNSWHNDVENTQGEEIWLLQRICERGKPFSPFKPENFTTFDRNNYRVYLFDTNSDAIIFEKGIINILNYSIFKFGSTPRGARYIRPNATWSEKHLSTNLAVICWLIEDAKVNVIDFKAEQEMQKSHMSLI